MNTSLIRSPQAQYLSRSPRQRPLPDSPPNRVLSLHERLPDNRRRIVLRRWTIETSPPAIDCAVRGSINRNQSRSDLRIWRQPPLAVRRFNPCQSSKTQSTIGRAARSRNHRTEDKTSRPP